MRNMKTTRRPPGVRKEIGALELLPIDEVAEMTGLTQNTIRRHVYNGGLKAIKLNGLHFKLDDVEKWVLGRRVVPGEK
jgi:excisionase family DNA binding protein